MKIAQFSRSPFSRWAHCFASAVASMALSATSSFAQTSPDALFSLSGPKDGEPTIISSQSLTVMQKERRFEYLGQVEVLQGDMRLTANKIVGIYNEENRIDDLVASGGVTITKGPTIRATGAKAVYSRKLDTIVLSESPALEQEGSLLTADKITVFLSQNRSTAEGQVRVKLVQKGAGSADAGRGSLNPALK